MISSYHLHNIRISFSFCLVVTNAVFCSNFVYIELKRNALILLWMPLVIDLQLHLDVLCLDPGQGRLDPEVVHLDQPEGDTHVHH